MNEQYVSSAESYRIELAYARTLTIKELNKLLKDRLAFHDWAVRAYEQALSEKEKP